MDEINKLLEKTGLSNLKESGVTIISLYGVSEANRSVSPSNPPVTLANRIVGYPVFTLRNEPLKENTLELVEGLQLYVDTKSKTVYLFMDSNLDTTILANEKSFSDSMMKHQTISMKGLLLMLTVSHLVIPILPPTVLPTCFLSVLVTLYQVKSNMYTHLAQFQTSCWKHWDISVPVELYEKKESERTNTGLLGWWGPAKGVPMMVFIASDLPFEKIIPTTVTRIQNSIQDRIKAIFRAAHLVPLETEGNKVNSPVEARSLFLLPSGTQPILHIVPAAPQQLIKERKSSTLYSFDEPISISSYLSSLSLDVATKEPQHDSTTLYYDYSDKLLRNFVGIWTKTAVAKYSLHTSKKGDHKTSPLPTAIQFISAFATVTSFIFLQPMTEDGVDFKKVITSQFPNTKGMIQQIEVIIRKKIKANVEIERVFSKSQSLGVMQKCHEAYLQDSPPFYTEQFHIWKRNNVVRMYRSLARGPCMEEYAYRLERECDTTWKQGRQSCEHTSLTGRPCRLKFGHEKNETPTPSQKQSNRADDRSIIIDPRKHNSSVTFVHACSCGKSQRIRDDPFDILDANITFYHKFGCCMGISRVAALDIEESTFGGTEVQQNIVLRYDDIPAYDISLLCLGPSNVYKNNVGLDKVEGFMNNTNFLIPWSITTVTELKLRHQEQETATTAAVNKDSSISNIKSEMQQTSTISSTHQPASNRNADNTIEWPALSKHSSATAIKSTPTPIIAPAVASLEAFPALGSTPSTPTKPAIPTTPTTAANQSSRQLFDTGRRKRHHRMRDRAQSLVRGYVGAEYECPHGHRFLSCGEGRVCKLGHADHPKEHGNYFVHQDLPIYIMCPCTYANSNTAGHNNPGGAVAGGVVTGGANGNNNGNNVIEVTAQLMRLYVATPDEALTISIEPKIKINVPGNTEEQPLILDLGIDDTLLFGRNGVYVLRLPFVYRNKDRLPIPVETDIQKRLQSAVLQKDCIKFHYKNTEKWTLPIM